MAYKPLRISPTTPRVAESFVRRRPAESRVPPSGRPTSENRSFSDVRVPRAHPTSVGAGLSILGLLRLTLGMPGTTRVKVLDPG